MKLITILTLIVLCCAPAWAQKDPVKENPDTSKNSKDVVSEKEQLQNEQNKAQQEDKRNQNQPNPDEREKSKIDSSLLDFMTKSQPGSICRVVVQLVNPSGVTFNKCHKNNLKHLAKTIRSTQDQFLKQLPTGMFTPQTYVTLQYAIAGQTHAQGIKFMASLDSVAYVTQDRMNHPMTVEGASLMGVTSVISTRGFTGTGVTVATIDGACLKTHSEFSNANLVDSYDFSNSDSNIAPSPVTADSSYHGTGVFGIIHRIAPGASQAHYQVFDNAYDSVIANAINRCITKNSEGLSPAIRVISMSLGGGRYYSAISSSDTIGNACSNALTAGIISFAASGNDGWTNSMGSPAAHTSVVSVSSVMDANGAAYSPFPPAYSTQPSGEKLAGYWMHYADVASFLDLFAPSEDVITTNEYGSTSSLGGTSSATPEAAAATAILLQAAPSLIGNKAGIISLYQSTGATVPNNPVSSTSAKLIKLNLALDSVLGTGGGSTPPPEPPPSGSSAIANGGSVSGSVTQGAWSHFYTTLPSNVASLSVVMNGNGDADLYVKKGSQPSSGSYDFRPYLGGTAETVSVTTSTTPPVSGGDWYISVYGYASGSSAFDIVVNWTTSGGGSTPPPEPEPDPDPIGVTTETEPNNAKTVSGSNLLPTPNVPLTGTVSSSDVSDYFRVEVSAPINFTVELDVPTGVDYDLYMYKGTSSTAVGSSTLGGSATESITYSPTSGTVFYIRVKRYSGTTTSPYVLTVNWY